MDVQGQIRAWLLGQQDWLQEAADRLLKHGKLTADDIAAVAALLKTKEGQAVTKHRPFDELTHAPAGSSLRLSRIDGVSGIESLGPRQPLDFGIGNLTVIYGHNGSGKSCYTRILKKVSGKPRATDLKPNVFQEAPAESKCTISFQQDQNALGVEWHVGSPPIEALRDVDIFDSDEASHYLRSESTATYTPPMIALFEKLVAATDKVKVLLDEEQEKLVSALPALPFTYQQTEAARSYRALSAITGAALEQLLQWTPQDTQSLEALTERLKVDDPAALAKQKRATKAQVVQIIDSARQASKSYSSEHLEVIRSLRTTAAAKRQIAVEGAKVQSAVLDGVGMPTWHALWEAARNYSSTPYPTVPFPVTTNARCILCQQDLSSEAQQRLIDFERFVQGKLESDAQAAERLHSEELSHLPLAPSEAQLQTQCAAAGLTDPQWSEALWKFWNEASKNRHSLQNHELIEAAIPIHSIEKNILILETYRDQLEGQAAQFEKDALEFDRVKAGNDKLALEARQWVAQQAEAVRSEIRRQGSIKTYEAWKTCASSRRISTKATEVSENVVTEAYVARFNRELRSLGASRIQVELLKTRTTRGKVLHQLRLKGVKNGDDLPEKVLSEGERRIISLAAFLADVADKPGAAPFVFDDPISSLDHDFEWHVACRLANLAQHRQVLVFTHRLSLYGVLEDVAKKVGEDWKKANYRAMCIESFSGVSGHPADQAVWNSNTKSANNILLDRLRAAKKAGETDGAGTYQALAQGICSDLRKLLERSVEDDLLNKVVQRHRRSVTTDGRLSGLQGILVEELNFIDDLMTKYSCFEHSQSSEIPIMIPEEPELKADIESLQKWRTDLNDRRKQAV